MPRLLILLTLPPDVTEQYRLRLSKAFPEVAIDVAADKAKAEGVIRSADMLLTFGQMLKNLKFDLKDAANLKWVQALGTGLDGITDQPSLRPSVTVTSLHGVHGAPVSEAALAGMLALSRDIPRFVRQAETQTWGRWPAKLLHEKTVGILGFGEIGACYARMLQPYDTRTLYYKRTPLSAHQERHFNVEYATMDDVLAELDREGGITRGTRFSLAAEAFAHTAAYDAAIASTLRGVGQEDGRFERRAAAAGTPLAPALDLRVEKVQDLRYGENPHQAAAWYRPAGAGSSELGGQIGRAHV